MVFQKVGLSGSKLTCPSLLLVYEVYRTSIADRGRNGCRSNVIPILDISIRSGDIRDRSLKLSEVDPNFVRFWPPIFFSGGGILGPTL